MKSFHDLRKKLDEAGMYGMTPDMLKKAKAENPLKGKGYPYNEMSAKAHYRKFKKKGIVTGIDRNKYPNREKQGLEGPYRSKKSGQIYYYDKKAGKYYDTDTDMYLQVNDIMEDVNPEYDEELSKMNIGEAISSDKLLKIFNKLKPKDTVEIKYDSGIRKGKNYQKFVVTSGKRTVGKARVERIIMKSVDNPGGVKYTLFNRKGNVSLAVGDMGVSIVDIKESVELDEYLRKDVYAIVDKKGKVVAANLTKKNSHKEISRHRDGTIVLDPDAKTGDILKTFAKESVDLVEGGHTDVASAKNQVKIAMSAMQKMQTELSKLNDEDSLPTWWTNKVAVAVDKLDGMADYLDTQVESVEVKEDNTAMVAKKVKQVIKKHVTGTPRVRSKGGKTRFIQVSAQNIDNKLRKKILDVAHPNANVRDMKNISYGNITSNMISAKVDVWMKALGIEEDIANTAGSGAIAGLDDKPPVSRAAQKKKQRSGGATGGIPAPKKGDLIPPALEEEVDTFAGCRVFEVEDEEYGKALYGRQKYERWNHKFDMTKETNQMIRTYANRNPGKGIVVKNKKTGDMSYLINRKY